MTKSINIYEQEDCFKISREVITPDDLPIEYPPIYIIQKEPFDYEKWEEAIFESLSGYGEKVDWPVISADKNQHKKYLAFMSEEFKETSYSQLLKKSRYFQVELTNDSLKITPGIEVRGGFIGNEDRAKEISRLNMSKKALSRAVKVFIDSYYD